MDNTLFPKDLLLNLNNSPARINWLRRVGKSCYVKSGITFVGGGKDGGSQYWILLMEGREIVPLFMWPSFTEEEEEKVIEMIRSMREKDEE